MYHEKIYIFYGSPFKTSKNINLYNKFNGYALIWKKIIFVQYSLVFFFIFKL